MGKGLVLLALVFLICVTHLTAQKVSKTKLEMPEKMWVMMHPFISVRVKNRLEHCYSVIEQVKKQKSLDQFENGGCLDAFRHVFTMAFLAQHIRISKLRSLGVAHEKSNRIQFEKNIFENGELPDSVSCQMDLLNNEIGFILGKKYRNVGTDSLAELIVVEIMRGFAWQIARDQNGNYLRCDGREIDIREWERKWRIPKCLVKSNSKLANN